MNFLKNYLLSKNMLCTYKCRAAARLWFCTKLRYMEPLNEAMKSPRKTFQTNTFLYDFPHHEILQFVERDRDAANARKKERRMNDYSQVENLNQKTKNHNLINI